MNVSGLARTNDTAVAETGDGRSSFDLETVLGVAGAVAPTALGNVIEANALNRKIVSELYLL